MPGGPFLLLQKQEWPQTLPGVCPLGHLPCPHPEAPHVRCRRCLWCSLVRLLAAIDSRTMSSPIRVFVWVFSPSVLIRKVYPFNWSSQQTRFWLHRFAVMRNYWTLCFVFSVSLASVWVFIISFLLTLDLICCILFLKIRAVVSDSYPSFLSNRGTWCCDLSCEFYLVGCWRSSYFWKYSWRWLSYMTTVHPSGVAA